MVDALGTLCWCLTLLVPCIGVWCFWYLVLVCDAPDNLCWCVMSRYLVLVFDALGTLYWCLVLLVPCVGV